MPPKIKWNGPRLQALIAAEMARRLQAAAIAVWRRAKLLIAVEGTAKRAAKTRKHAKGTLAYGADPSKPGEPPHKQTGRLLGSVAWEVSGLLARVGTNLKYGRWLELGTGQMAARPWLRRALNEMKAAIARLLTAPMDPK